MSLGTVCVTRPSTSRRRMDRVSSPLCVTRPEMLLRHPWPDESQQVHHFLVAERVATEEFAVRVDLADDLPAPLPDDVERSGTCT